MWMQEIIHCCQNAFRKVSQAQICKVYIGSIYVFNCQIGGYVPLSTCRCRKKKFIWNTIARTHLGIKIILTIKESVEHMDGNFLLHFKRKHIHCKIFPLNYCEITKIVFIVDCNIIPTILARVSVCMLAKSVIYNRWV